VMGVGRDHRIDRTVGFFGVRERIAPAFAR
jgi:hypothetical protein